MTAMFAAVAILLADPTDNPVRRLDRRLAAGESSLAWTDPHGRLKAVLAALDVPVSSQVLVFSRTSLQRDRIGPRTPRAIYFNDDVTVGFCRHGDVLELSASDPAVGTAFYTLDQKPEATRFVRQTDSCLICHGSSATGGLPGHLARSVWPDRRGDPVLSRGSVRVGMGTPLADRWGGWYVTGTGPAHRGNRVVDGWAWADPKEPPAADDVTDLKPFFGTHNYLSPHSDVVALLVLEHQVDTHNRFTKAAAVVRQALAEQAELNKLSGRPAGERWDSIAGRIERACEPVVEALLFCGEPKLDKPVAGTSGFAADFAGRGPFDSHGRSLRQFDLRTRLFRHPLSYLIYSRGFAGLPAEVRERVYLRLREVLTGADTTATFAHLSAADRRAAWEVLQATRPRP